MNGIDPGTIAQNIVTYFGGPAGGYVLVAALLVVGILTACHLVSSRFFMHTLGFGVFAWCASFMIRTFLGWA